MKWVWLAKKSNNSTTVKPRITKFCRDIVAELGYSHTRYDVTSYFRSAFIEVQENDQKCCLRWLYLTGHCLMKAILITIVV